MIDVLSCIVCGGEMDEVSSDKYKCRYCGKTIVLNDGTESIVKKVLAESKKELTSAARKNLWDAMHAKYISSEACIDCARELKKLVPDDYYANFAEVANSKSDEEISKFLYKTSKVECDAYGDAVLDFMIRSLTPGTLTAVCAFIDKAYDVDDSEYSNFQDAFAKEAVKVDKGIYELGLTRDVCLVYSSKDMPKVLELSDYLEKLGITCFLALRNLQHGRGAVDNYEKAICTAMDNCKMVVFVSSKNSRSLSCDALKQELPYLRKTDKIKAPAEYANIPYDKFPPEYMKPRIEYVIEGYDSELTPADKTVKEIFHGIEWSKSKEDVADRIGQYLTSDPDELLSDFSGKRNDDYEKEKILFSTDAIARKYTNKGKFKKARAKYRELQESRTISSAMYWGFLRCDLKAYDDYDLVSAPGDITKNFNYSYALNSAENDDIKKYYQDIGENQKKHKPAEVYAENYPRTNYRLHRRFNTIKAVVAAVLAACVVAVAVFVGVGASNPLKYSINGGAATLEGKNVFFNMSSRDVEVDKYKNTPVTSIGESALADSSVKSVKLASSVTEIGSKAFMGCDRLTTVSIESTDVNIGDYAFSDCGALTEVTFGSEFVSPFSVSLSATLLASTSTYVYADSQTVIGSGAFQNCTSLTEITVYGCTYLGAGAFSGCTSLSEIHLDITDDSVIAAGALSGLASDTVVYVPTIAEDSLESLETAYSGLEFETFTRDAVEECVYFIDKLSRENSEENIKFAEELYDSLTSSQKRQVENHDTLQTASNALTTVDAIEAIGEVTLSSRSDIEYAEELYASLSDEYRAYVTNYTTLTDARAVYDVMYAIDSIKTISLDNAADIRGAYDMFSALSEELQSKVTNSSDLLSICDILTVMEAIDDVADLNIDSGTKIANAESIYDALTDSEKTYVSNYADLLDARAAYDVAVVIDGMGEITLDSGDIIAGAETLYGGLTSSQMDKVFNYSELEDARSVYDVMCAIDDIGTVTLDSESKISVAESQYDALDSDLKAKILNYDALEEARLVYDVMYEIDLIDEISLEKKDEIVSAWDDYNALTDDIKSKVTNGADIVSMYSILETMVAIDGIGAVTLESDGDITAAENLYGALSEAEKAYVSNYGELTDARSVYTVMKAIDDIGTVTLGSGDSILAAEKLYGSLDATLAGSITNAGELADARAVYDVMTAIDGIGEVTLDSETDISTCETLFDALRTDLKDKVGNLADLTDARTIYDMMCFINLISLGDVEGVYSLRESYDALDAGLKARVTNSDWLISACDILDTISAIDAIGIITPDSGSSIVSAETLYGSLTEDEKKYVSNAQYLTDARAAYDVVSAIDKIGDVTLSSDVLISDAEYAYESLTSGQKDMVSNYGDLVDDRDVYTVMAAIDGLGDITLESLSDITRCESLFDGLREDLRSRVSNSDELEDARTIYDFESAIDSISLDDREGVYALCDEYDTLRDDLNPRIVNAEWLTSACRIFDTIDAIDVIDTTSITMGSESYIIAAESLYESLVENEKAHITNARDLTDARAAFDVVSAIDKIGEVTLDSGFDISDAETAYGTLTSDQQSMVSNYGDLVDDRAVYAVMTAIDGLGDIGLESEDDIIACEALYADLRDNIQDRVSNYNELVDARCVYDMIYGINQISLDDPDYIYSLIDDFDALSDELKPRVTNSDCLVSATNILYAIEALDKIEKINVGSESDIENAEALYNSLSDDEKLYVSNADYLLDARNILAVVVAIDDIYSISFGCETIDNARGMYDSLIEEQQPRVGNRALLFEAEQIYDVVDLINNIGYVTELSYSLIIEAEDQYNALTDSQKEYVTNHDVLEGAIASYSFIKNFSFPFYLGIGTDYTSKNVTSNNYVEIANGDCSEYDSITVRYNVDINDEFVVSLEDLFINVTHVRYDVSEGYDENLFPFPALSIKQVLVGDPDVIYSYTTTVVVCDSIEIGFENFNTAVDSGVLILTSNATNVCIEFFGKCSFVCYGADTVLLGKNVVLEFTSEADVSLVSGTGEYYEEGGTVINTTSLDICVNSSNVNIYVAGGDGAGEANGGIGIDSSILNINGDFADTTITVIGGDGGQSPAGVDGFTGGRGISVAVMSADYNGTLIVMGGNGSDGGEAETSYSVTSYSSTGKDASSGQSGGAGGRAVYVSDTITVYGYGTYEFIGGDGGVGSAGGNGQGIAYSYTYSYGYAGRGGTGGAGGEGGTALYVYNVYFFSAKSITCKAGSGADGGNGGDGGYCSSTSTFFTYSGCGGKGGDGGNSGYCLNVRTYFYSDVNVILIAGNSGNGGNGGTTGSCESGCSGYINSGSTSIGGNGGNNHIEYGVSEISCFVITFANAGNGGNGGKAGYSETRGSGTSGAGGTGGNIYLVGASSVLVSGKSGLSGSSTRAEDGTGADGGAGGTGARASDAYGQII